MKLALNKNKSLALVTAVLRYLILTALAFVVLYPLIIKIELSFMNVEDLTDATVRFVPKTLTLMNFKAAISGLDYGISLAQTLLFVVSITAVQVFFSMITAYGLASFRFPGRNIVFGFVLATLIIPPQTIMLSLYFRFQSLSMVGITLPLYIMAATGLGLKNGLLIFIFRQFFKGFPREIEESALIDGAGVFRTFISIVMPSSRATSLTAFLLTFVWQYTDGFYTSVFIPDNRFLSKMLQMGDSAAQQLGSSLYTGNPYFQSLVKNASILLYIAPVLLLFFICQKHFIESVERTGLVG